MIRILTAIGILLALLSGALGQASVRVCSSSPQVCIAVNADGSINTAATFTPSGTQDVNLTKVGGAAVALGQAAMAASIPVALASNQSSIPVAATLGAETTKVVGTVNQGTSPWITAGGGTAGSAATGILTVQGIAGMTKLLVTPDSVALPANQSVNVAQINGVTPLMGNGTTGTGSHRVTVASDNTAFAVNPLSATAPVSTMNSASANSGINAAMAGVFDDAAPTAITENSFGFARMSANRNLYGTIRDAAGNERGANVSAGNALLVDASATTQPTNHTQVNGVAVSTGNGVVGTGVQRVAVASDNTAFSVNATPVAPAINTYVGNVNTEGTKTTYSFGSTGIQPAAAGTDFLCINGSGTKTIRITRLQLSGIATAASAADVLLIKRSTANTGGTPASFTLVPNDSNNTAATASATLYTTNPTLGTTVGTVRAAKMTLSTSAGAIPIVPIVLDFTVNNSQGFVLRGTAQGLCLNWNTQTITGNLLDVDGQFTEE